jgi:hypothetical protein
MSGPASIDVHARYLPPFYADARVAARAAQST